MRLFFTYLILVSTILFSCKKDKLPEIPSSNDPVFSVAGDIDGNSFELTAGVENTLMKDEIEIRNNVNYFLAQLSNEVEEIRFSLADGELDKTNKDWKIENTSTINLLPFFELPLYSMNVFTFSNSQMLTNILWEVNGEVINGEKVDFNEPGIYKVCGEFTFLGGASTTVCNDLIIGFERSKEIHVLSEYVEPAVFQLDLNLDNGELSSINWYVNDTLFSTDSSPLLYTNAEHNLVRCEFTTSTGVAREREIYLNRDNQELYVEDFGNFEKNSDGFADYLINLQFDLSFGSYKAIPYEDDIAITIDEVLMYEETANKTIYLVKGSFVGKMLNLNTEDIVDAQINFNFALPINK